MEEINDGGNEEATRILSHASQFGVSADEFVRLAHEKLPFFNSISELQASGYDFRRLNGWFLMDSIWQTIQSDKTD